MYYINLRYTHWVRLLEFVQKDVSEELQLFDETTNHYISDSGYYNDLITEFKNVADDLLMAIESITDTIDSVSRAAVEGAQGTTDIATRNTQMNQNSQDVLDKVQKTQVASDELNKEVNKFRLE